MIERTFQYQETIQSWIDAGVCVTINSDKTRRNMDMDVWHPKMHQRFEYLLRNMMYEMVEHFTPTLTLAETFEIFASPEQIPVLQAAGRLMGESNTEIKYNIAPKMAVSVSCYGNDKLPTVLLPKDIYDKGKLFDTIKPLIDINTSWTALLAAYRQMPELMNNTREMNVYFPWLKLLLPPELRGGTIYKNAIFHWFEGVEKPADMNRVERQFNIIRGNSRPSRFTWFPRELVRIAATGKELITQYNLLKDNIESNPQAGGYAKISLLTTIEMDVNGLMIKARNSQDIENNGEGFYRG